MIAFPYAKINLGLNVVARRSDGYHDLETVFYPVPLCDALEVNVMDSSFPSDIDCDLKVTGISVEGDEQRNLVVRAYAMLKQERPQLPRVHVHLYKSIPTQAGMGGGSSDGATMLSLLNSHFALGFSQDHLIERAARLGADCPFFVISPLAHDGNRLAVPGSHHSETTMQAAYAEGIGERLQPIGLNLRGWLLAVVRPPVPVSTKEAFALVTPKRPAVNCLEVVRHPVEEWRRLLVNDFEQSVFAQHPEIGRVKENLYGMGAVYSAMSGSGSAVFALFTKSSGNTLSELDLQHHFPGMFTRIVSL